MNFSKYLAIYTVYKYTYLAIYTVYKHTVKVQREALAESSVVFGRVFGR